MLELTKWKTIWHFELLFILCCGNNVCRANFNIVISPYCHYCYVPIILYFKHGTLFLRFIGLHLGPQIMCQLMCKCAMV